MSGHAPIEGRFAGQTVIVTGAGSGIGRATAVRLAMEGAARVVAADVSVGRLEDLVAEFPGAGFVPVVGDVSREDAVQAVVAAADGRVDALANVAGIMDRFLPPGEIDDATWERVFAVNVTSIMRLTRAVLPLMQAAGRGAIVNISSEARLTASASGATYAASKHAVNGFTQSTALFYRAQGIRANAVAPGAVRTNIEAPMTSALAQATLGPLMQVNVGTPAMPEDLAALICWLLSDDASNVNGAIIACDGGWSTI